MRTTLVLIALSCAASAQTITSVAFDGVSHSALRMTISYTGDFDALRARYVPTPASCTDGKTGPIQAIGYQAKFRPMPVLVSGLEPGIEYQICPELSADGGNTWSKGFGATVRTQALMAQDPALPIAPEKFNSDYPDTRTFARVATRSDCSDLADLLRVAIRNSLYIGTVINLPERATCVISHFDFDANPGDILWFGQSAVSTSANTLSLTDHGLVEGQKIQVANYSPYWGGSLPQTVPVALADGQTYYAHVVNANAIQIYLGAPADRGGTLLTFVSPGTGFADNYVVPLPRRTKPIIIQAAGVDTALPEHVRVTANDAKHMTRLVMSRSQIGANPQHYMFRFTDLDSNIRRPIGNLRLVGLEFTTEDFLDLHNTIDPADYENMFLLSPWNSEITMDRCYVHSLGAPTRWHRGMFWDGAYLAVVDSLFETLTYYHAMNEGIVASIVDSHHAQITAGVSYSGGSTHKLLAPVTIEISGNGSGEILTGWDLQTDKWTIWTPPGIAATCSGVACTVLPQSGSIQGTCDWRDAWPHNASGWVSAHPTGCFGAAGGALNAVVQGNPYLSQWATEGSNWMIGGLGPGPYKLIHSTVDGAGLPWHHDDSGKDKYLRGDYDYEQNVFRANFRYRFGSAQSDHLMYAHRQMLEWKSGQRIYLRGNTFDGGWTENNGASTMLTLTAVNGQTISDVHIESNEFKHGPGVLNLMYPTKGGTPVVIPPRRFLFRNNLIWDINSGSDTTCDGQPSYFVAGGGAACSTGWIFQGPVSSEYVVVDHNTILGNSGRVPSLFRLGDGPVRGVVITNNIFTFVDRGFTLEPLAFGDPCLNLSGKELADCKLPGYIFAGNIIFGHGEGFAAKNILADATSSSYINANFSTTSATGGAGADLVTLRAAQGTQADSFDSDCTSCLPAVPTIPSSGPSEPSFPASPPTSGPNLPADNSADPVCVDCTPSKTQIPPATSVSNPPLGLRYVPVAPCRIMDTREQWDEGGGPSFGIGEIRVLSMISEKCNLPAAAGAYAINVTVVPLKPLRWITLWPAGVAMPFTSVLNSYDSRVKAVSTIVAAGNQNSINIFTTDETHVIIDVSGYFTSDSESTFHTLSPCRVLDTRGLPGSPSIPAMTERNFPLLRSECGLPETVDAYAVNLTVIPRGSGLAWMSAWPSGLERPFASSVNDPTPSPVANSAIIKRGIGGEISVYGSDDFDLIVDVTGYFSSQPGGYSFYATSPCRSLDTRESGTQSTLSDPIRVDATRACNLPAHASAIAGVVTAIPEESLEYLTLWGDGDRPQTSTLNAYDGAITSNFAITPLESGSFRIFRTNSTHVAFDIMGYFAP